MNDILLLGMLLEGPKHGYRLKQDAVMFSASQQLHNNTVYPLLKRYLDNGWITKREAGGERGQTRLLYSLTPSGKLALTEKLIDFSPGDASSAPAFRLRVGLFDLLSREDRERILRLRDDFLAARLKRVQQVGKSRELGFWPGSTVAFVITELQLERRWIARLITQI